MSEEIENQNENLTSENEESANLDITNNQKIDVLADGTEILRDGYDDEEEIEEISDDNLRKLVQFTTGRNNLSDTEIQELKTNEVELERLIKISMIKSRHFNYNPKKVFNSTYRKERKRKNRQVSKSRAFNRK